ncbi:MAG: hypothetical protein NTY68_05445 [Candidatus Micrarchaeota archaeon]|nr:hypothetical protein [Candidatus Micrarchaeota archaeon]
MAEYKKQPKKVNAETVKVEPMPDFMKNLLVPPSGKKAKSLAKSAFIGTISDSVSAKINLGDTVAVSNQLSLEYEKYRMGLGAKSPYVIFKVEGNDPFFDYLKITPQFGSSPDSTRYSRTTWTRDGYFEVGAANTDYNTGACDVILKKSGSPDNYINEIYSIYSRGSFTVGQSKVMNGNTVTLNSVDESNGEPVSNITIKGTAKDSTFNVPANWNGFFFGGAMYCAESGFLKNGGFANILSLKDERSFLSDNGCKVQIDDFVDVKNVNVSITDPNGNPIATHLSAINYSDMATYGNSDIVNLNGKVSLLTIHENGTTSNVLKPLGDSTTIPTMDFFSSHGIQVAVYSPTSLIGEAIPIDTFGTSLKVNSIDNINKTVSLSVIDTYRGEVINTIDVTQGLYPGYNGRYVFVGNMTANSAEIFTVNEKDIGGGLITAVKKNIAGAKTTESKFMSPTGAGKYKFVFEDRKIHNMEVLNLQGKLVGSFSAEKDNVIDVMKEAKLSVGGSYLVRERNSKNIQSILIR